MEMGRMVFCAKGRDDSLTMVRAHDKATSTNLIVKREGEGGEENDRQT